MAKRHICMIGGTGRSGTTILARIFANHPKIAYIPESRFLIDPGGLVDFYLHCDKWSPYHYDQQIKRLQWVLKKVSKRTLVDMFFSLAIKTKVFRRIISHLKPAYSNIQVSKYCPNYDDLCRKLMDELIAFQYAGTWEGKGIGKKSIFYYNDFQEKPEMQEIISAFLNEFIDSIVDAQKTSYFLEKNTWNILWFGTILELLPNAKLVHIYRDPRDVVASFTKQTWMPSNPRKSAIIYKNIVSKWQQIKNSVPYESFIEISLEKLVSNPENVLKTICEFWELDWNNALLNVDLSRSHSGRWKADLSLAEQKDIQSILNEVIKDLGYAE